MGSVIPYHTSVVKDMTKVYAPQPLKYVLRAEKQAIMLN